MKFWLAGFFFLLTSLPVVSQQNLSQIKLDSVQFEDADLPSVLDFLGLKARELKGKPANFVLYDPDEAVAAADPRITLSLKNIPFSMVVKYASQTSGTRFLIDRHVVWFGRAEDLQTLRVRQNARSGMVYRSATFRRFAQTPVAEIDFTNTSLSEVIDGLRELDRSKQGNGNFLTLAGPEIMADGTTINLKLANLSLADVIQYSAEVSGFVLEERQGVIIFRAPDALAQTNHPGGGPGYQIIKHLSVSDATLAEMIDYIQHHSKTRSKPDGINLISLTSSTKKVSLDLKNVSLTTILDLVCDQIDCTYQMDQSAIQIIDLPQSNR